MTRRGASLYILYIHIPSLREEWYKAGYRRIPPENPRETLCQKPAKKGELLSDCVCLRMEGGLTYMLVCVCCVLLVFNGLVILVYPKCKSVPLCFSEN